LVKRVVEVDYATGACIGCQDDEEARTVRRVAAFRGNPAIEAWVKESFRSDYRPEEVFPADLSGDSVFGELSSLVVGGFIFKSGSVTVNYDQRRLGPSEFWTGWMSVRRGPGRFRWSRRVLLMHLPVCPFVVGNYLMYLGANSPETRLIIRDIHTGSLLVDWVPANDPDGLGNPNTSYRLPFYLDGYIYVEGAAEVDHFRTHYEGKDGAWPFKKPPRAYVIKIGP